MSRRLPRRAAGALVRGARRAPHVLRALLLAAAVLGTAGPACAALPAGYHLVDLGDGMLPMDIDAAAHVAGTDSPPRELPAREHPVIWADDHLVTLRGARYNGVVAGVAGARAVGWVTAKPSPNSDRVAVLWVGAGAAPVRLALPAGARSASAWRVLADGTIYGTVVAPGTGACVRWRGAGPDQPGVPELLATDCWLVDAAAPDLLALQRQQADGSSSPALWRDGAITDIGALMPGAHLEAQGVNAAGHVSVGRIEPLDEIW